MVPGEHERERQALAGDDEAVAAHDKGMRVAEQFGDADGLRVGPDELRIVPERRRRIEIAAETVPRPRRATERAEAHGFGRHRTDHAADIRPPSVDLAVDANLAQHAFGQGTVERYDGAGFAWFDQPERACRRDQKPAFVETQAAMAVGMHKPVAAERA